MELIARNENEMQIEIERRKLRKLELIRFKQFRHTVLDKLRRQSERASELRKQFGLGSVAPSVPARHRPTSPIDTMRRSSIAQFASTNTMNQHQQQQSTAIHPRTQSLAITQRPSVIINVNDDDSTEDDDELTTMSNYADHSSMLAPSSTVGENSRVSIYIDVQVGIYCFFENAPLNRSELNRVNALCERRRKTKRRLR